jgi:hypothetical protein
LSEHVSQLLDCGCGFIVTYAADGYPIIKCRHDGGRNSSAGDDSQRNFIRWQVIDIDACVAECGRVFLLRFHG